MITNKEFVENLLQAIKVNTVYANGMFGQPISKAIIEQKTKQLSGWYEKYNRKEKLLELVGKDYFGFDCVCFVKGILWGWNANLDDVNGGAKYKSNGVLDIGEDSMINVCSDISTDFSNVEICEYLWIKGHCGIYIGNGLAIECTTGWENKVQITAVANISTKSGYNARTWTKHGKLPYVDYVKEVISKPEEPAEETVTVNLLVLRRGAHRGDPQIKTAQRILKLCGYYTMNIDGSYGPGTELAVKAFQADYGLVADGIVGINTWTVLLTKI